MVDAKRIDPVSVNYQFAEAYFSECGSAEQCGKVLLKMRWSNCSESQKETPGLAIFAGSAEKFSWYEKWGSN
jgi:hypothetical protein